MKYKKALFSNGDNVKYHGKVVKKFRQRKTIRHHEDYKLELYPTMEAKIIETHPPDSSDLEHGYNVCINQYGVRHRISGDEGDNWEKL